MVTEIYEKTNRLLLAMIISSCPFEKSQSDA